MKNKLLYFILIPFIISGCSILYKYSVSITNLDTDEKRLRLNFKFDKHKTQSIKIKNASGSVVLEGYFKSPIQNFTYPNSLDSIVLVYPPTKDEASILTKDKMYRFVFGGTIEWEYQPFYSTKEGRWLFDEGGNQKDFAAIYERWLGKDVILVQTPHEIKVDSSTFIIRDENGKKIEHTIKSKTNPSKKFALILNKDEPKDKTLTILILSNNGVFVEGDNKYNCYFIKVPNKSTIGLVGKYNSL